MEMTKTRLPMSVEEVNAAWVQDALSGHFPGIQVKSIELDNFSHGAATRARVTIDASYSGSGAQPPKTVWLKTGFEGHHDFAMPNYLIENDFYQHIRELLPVRSPECFFAGTQDDPPQATLLLEDLSAKGMTFCVPTRPLTVDQCASGLEQLALLHSTDIENPTLKRLLKPIEGVRYATTERGTQVERFFKWTRAYAGPVCLLDADRIRAGFDVYWKMIFGNAQQNLVHGDTHVGNSYMAPNGEVSFLDWQGYGTGYWMQDVPYFMIGALDLPERRANEKELFKYYLAKREELGTRMPAFDDVWDDYRRAVYFGFITWIGNEDFWQLPENNMAQYARFCAAMIDHDTFKAMGV